MRRWPVRLIPWPRIHSELEPGVSVEGDLVIAREDAGHGFGVLG